MNKTKKILKVGKHLLLWLLNYLLIAFVVQSDWSGFSNFPDSGYNSLAFAYAQGLLFNAILFYLQVFWLVPKVYMGKNKVKYYALSSTIVMVISLIEAYFDYLLYDLLKIDMNDTFLDNFSVIVAINLLYTVAGFYYIFKLEHRKSEKIRQSLLEESYKTELKYLKAQMNPHFLFNGINSVYHLIGKNNVLAKETLLQFSELLRYQLYESETYILLEKELDYVSHYINIEKTRRGSDIQLDYDIAFESAAKKIAPLLLTPFIENAFKHCSNQSDKNTISIEILESGGKLTLHITNNFDHLAPEKPIGGIGLINVKRRLSLLYPDEHQLEIKKEEDNFTVTLSIKI